METCSTLILGIGNTLLSDEGAGVHAMYQLRSINPDIPNLVYVDGGTLSFTLAAYLQDCRNVIVLDAAELNAPPGTVKTMVGDAMDEFLTMSRRSAHEVGLLDLFDIARLNGTLPVNRALIGIQPQCIEWGMHPSPAVSRALGDAVEAALALLGRWQLMEPPGHIPRVASNPVADAIHREGT